MAPTATTDDRVDGYSSPPTWPPARLEVLPPANTNTAPLPPRPCVLPLLMALVMALLDAPPPQLLLMTCAPIQYHAKFSPSAICVAEAAAPQRKMRMGTMTTPGAA